MTVNQNLEEDLIGLLLRDQGARYFDINERLKAEHFGVPVCAAIYDAIDQIHKNGLSFSLSLVEERTRKQPAGITISAYLARLAVEAPHGVSAQDISDTLIDRWYRNEMARQMEKLPQLVRDTNIPGESLPEEIIARLMAAFQHQTPAGIRSAQEMAKAFRDRLTAAVQAHDQGQVASGVFTGLDFFDQLVGVLRPQAVTVIGGATSMGKSALAQQVALHLALSGTPTLVFSNEMDHAEVEDRWHAMMAHTNSERFVTGSVNADELDRALEHNAIFESLPLYVDDEGGTKVATIRTRSTTEVRKHGIKVVVIDHLGYIEPKRDHGTEAAGIAEVVKDIKRLARDLRVHVILVSHLSGNGQNLDARLAKDIRRPRLGDLHGSTEIQKTAHQVLFVHRPHYYLARNQPPEGSKDHDQWRLDVETWKGRAEIIKAKKRGGQGFGIREVAFHDAYTLFGEIAEHNRGPLL